MVENKLFLNCGFGIIDTLHLGIIDRPFSPFQCETGNSGPQGGSEVPSCTLKGGLTLMRNCQLAKTSRVSVPDWFANHRQAEKLK